MSRLVSEAQKCICPGSSIPATFHSHPISQIDYLKLSNDTWTYALAICLHTDTAEVEIRRKPEAPPTFKQTEYNITASKQKASYLHLTCAKTEVDLPHCFVCFLCCFVLFFSDGGRFSNGHNGFTKMCWSHHALK